MQATMGMAERLAQVGSIAIRDHLPQQHRDFFAQLPFLVVGSVDANTQPTASILVGAPGFVHSVDERTLNVAALPRVSDPLKRNLQHGAPLGILGIEPHTRRRNRVNGRVAGIAPDGFAVAVEQSFGNCPKYIRPRQAVHAPHRQPIAETMICADGLAGDARALIESADTCFIASAHPDAMVNGARANGVDVSHRAGPAGFISIAEDGALILPDYAGNRFFNTFGNLLLNPKAGLMIFDYHTGDVWQFEVSCQIVSVPDRAVLASGPAAERHLICRVKRTCRQLAAASLRWR